jgi:hypothetical protein
MKRWYVAVLASAAAWLMAAPVQAEDAAVRAEVKRVGDGWQLVRDGQPYLIKGGGGGGSKEVLAKLGGNSFRTWGVGDDTQKQLDEAQRLGLTVTLGIWLGHEDHGFRYDDAKQVAEQHEKAVAAIRRYKDHPAVLMWGIGNEMEGYQDGGNPLIWKAVEAIAAAAKKIDPNHPTMTVIAEVGGVKVKSVHELCPDVDVVGINTYGGVGSIGERYKKAGGTKPYVLTEFGPPGVWESGKNAFGVAAEPSSTKKGEIYRQAYLKGVLGQKGACLGSYVFTWGRKQEATATWFGLFLPDGTQLEAVHTMAELWSGKAPANRCPKMEAPKVAGSDDVAPGQTVRVALKVEDPDGDAVKVEWVLSGETKKHGVGGSHEDAPPTYPEAIVRGDEHGVELKMPAEPGVYRLYAYARDGHGNGAVANTVIRVKGEVSARE